MYFLAQAMPIVPTAFYGLTLTSSGLNILNICHNYKLSIAFNVNPFIFFFSQVLYFAFYSLHHSIFYFLAGI